MTARTPPKAAPLSEEESAGLMADAGSGFENQTVYDRATWDLPADPITADFVVAIERIDEIAMGRSDARSEAGRWISPSDTAHLAKLLRGPDLAMTLAARIFLADFLERYDLRLRKRGRRVPAYDRNELNWRIENAHTAYREEKASGSEPSLQKLADEFGLSLKTLEDEIAGDRSATARLKARRPPKA